MFVDEWRRARGGGRPRTIAIVDTDPDSQYLYPDMRLAQQCLSRRGIETFIASPETLEIRGERLMLGSTEIDLVYNRLTDFNLDCDAHYALRRAWLEDLAVVTPSPRHHALYANKRNMSLLSNEDRLAELGVHDCAELRAVPTTHVVNELDPDDLWARRKRLFFKPVDGFGSKAAYRGDKLTRKVWERICAGDYVAQMLVPPTTRAITHSGTRAELKYDLRIYTHAGRSLLKGARIYQGQTTNFRTQGGGLALVLDDQLLDQAVGGGVHCCKWLQVVNLD